MLMMMMMIEEGEKTRKRRDQLERLAGNWCEEINRKHSSKQFAMYSLAKVTTHQISNPSY